jgi:hypothetical protein
MFLSAIIPALREGSRVLVLKARRLSQKKKKNRKKSVMFDKSPLKQWKKVIMSKPRIGVGGGLKKLDNLAFTELHGHNTVLL